MFLPERQHLRVFAHLAPLICVNSATGTHRAPRLVGTPYTRNAHAVQRPRSFRISRSLRIDNHPEPESPSPGTMRGMIIGESGSKAY
jgi:hypothetical protein